MAIVEAMMREFDREASSTRALLERLPEDGLDWKPHEKSMALDLLASHLGEIPRWGVRTINEEGIDIDPDSYQPTVKKTRDEILAFFDENLKAFKTAMTATNDGVLMQPWTLKRSGQKVMSMPKVAVLRAWIFNHMIHHRGQLSVYLRLKDVPLPQTYGPSADERW